MSRAAVALTIQGKGRLNDQERAWFTSDFSITAFGHLTYSGYITSIITLSYALTVLG